MKERCAWALANERETAYHDAEWGVPVHDDRLLFEYLCLEGAQAGLSWSTILAKRENYRAAFDNFEALAIVEYDQDKVEELLTNPGIIRNKLKVKSVITNADAFLKIQQEFGSFDRYIWGFVNDRPIQNTWKDRAQVPVTSPIAQQLCKSLKRKGFKFVGPAICYAFMQAVGMVNDHTVDCFRYKTVKEMGQD